MIADRNESWQNIFLNGFKLFRHTVQRFGTETINNLLSYYTTCNVKYFRANDFELGTKVWRVFRRRSRPYLKGHTIRLNESQN